MSEMQYGGRAVVGAALLIAVAAAAAIVWWTGHQTASIDATREKASAQVEKLELVTQAGVHVLDVEIARTPEEQALGLMFRNELPDNRAMLFPYKTPRELSMWMRNTYIPLDMVFIRADGTVHRIEERTEPLSEKIISSEGPVTAVLEIAGGAASRIGLKTGDTVRHPHFGTAPKE